MAMMEKVNVCDTVGCRTLADRICALCKKDGCEQHLDSFFAVAFSGGHTTSSGTAGVRIEINVPACFTCVDVLRAIVTHGNPASTSVRHAQHKPTYTVLRERLGPVLDASLDDLRAAKAAETLVNSR